MKKTIFFMLLLSFAILFVSCQGDTDTQAEVTTGNKETVAETVTTSEVTSDEEIVTTKITTDELTEMTTEVITLEETTETNSTTEETTESSAGDISKYTALEYGISDSSVLGAQHTNDINIYVNSYKRLPEGTTKEITINGQTIELTYYESLEGSYYNDNYDSYHKMDDYNLTVVNINQKTGNVDFYFNSIRNYMDIVDVNNKKSEEECKSIAIEYFGNYANTDEYEIVRTISSDL